MDDDDRRLVAQLKATLGGDIQDITATVEIIIDRAKRLTRYAEVACNRELTEREMVFADHAESWVKAMVNHLDNKRGMLRVDFQGDPRGHVVVLRGDALGNLSNRTFDSGWGW